jgi:hypothetical protein
MNDDDMYHIIEDILRADIRRRKIKGIIMT